MPYLFIRRRRPAGLAPRRRTEPWPLLVRITSVTLDKRVPVRGVVVGILSGAVGVCVAFLVSGFRGAIGSPVVAVAQLAIELSPPPPGRAGPLSQASPSRRDGSSSPWARSQLAWLPLPTSAGGC